MPRRWTVWPESSWNGGIFDADVSLPLSVAIEPSEIRDLSPLPGGRGDSIDLQPREGSDGGRASAGPGGMGGGGRACHCGQDDCPYDPYDREMRRIEFDEALLHRMMEGPIHLVAPRKERQRRSMPGKRSTARTALSRGRYIRALQAGSLSRDIALDATIRAAALQQQHRERQGMTLKVEPSDLHAKVRERKVGNLLLFVVDCSASMGTQRRLLATQGAMLSLLVDAYQRRDRVGLVTFREESAAVILRPTASIELAKGAFQSLATGGTTPLSRGLLTAFELIQQERRRERKLIPVLILISDGWANVSMGEMAPGKEAALLAEMIRAEKIRSIVLGTGGQGWRMPDGSLCAPAEDLALVMGGEFHPMDEVTAERILEVIGSDRVSRD